MLQNKLLGYAVVCGTMCSFVPELIYSLNEGRGRVSLTVSSSLGDDRQSNGGVEKAIASHGLNPLSFSYSSFGDSTAQTRGAFISDSLAPIDLMKQQISLLPLSSGIEKNQKLLNFSLTPDLIDGAREIDSQSRSGTVPYVTATPSIGVAYEEPHLSAEVVEKKYSEDLKLENIENDQLEMVEPQEPQMRVTELVEELPFIEQEVIPFAEDEVTVPIGNDAAPISEMLNELIEVLEVAPEEVRIEVPALESIITEVIDLEEALPLQAIEIEAIPQAQQPVIIAPQPLLTQIAVELMDVREANDVHTFQDVAPQESQAQVSFQKPYTPMDQALDAMNILLSDMQRFRQEAQQFKQRIMVETTLDVLALKDPEYLEEWLLTPLPQSVTLLTSQAPDFAEITAHVKAAMQSDAQRELALQQVEQVVDEALEQVEVAAAKFDEAYDEVLRLLTEDGFSPTRHLQKEKKVSSARVKQLRNMERSEIGPAELGELKAGLRPTRTQKKQAPEAEDKENNAFGAFKILPVIKRDTKTDTPDEVWVDSPAKVLNTSSVLASTITIQQPIRQMPYQPKKVAKKNIKIKLIDYKTLEEAALKILLRRQAVSPKTPLSEGSSYHDTPPSSSPKREIDATRSSLHASPVRRKIAFEGSDFNN